MNARQVADTLAHVYDPELGIDVVALGLVYAIDTAPGRASVLMTTTTASCPMGPAILEDAETMLNMRFPGDEIEVRPIFDPPWDIRMASDEALSALGFPVREVRAGG